MSTEPDKDSFSLKRHRGGEGGLDDVLGTPGPEKKRRKSSTQAPSFFPVSEYAPPPNPSSDHLIASNPFDDGYSLPSVKALPSANPYFGSSHYSGFSGYGTSRIAPHMGHRMPSYPYQMRNQPQNPMGMGYNRAPGFNYPQNPSYGHQFGSGHNSMGHPFRPGPGENINQMNPLQNRIVARFGPDGNAPFAKTTPNVSPKLPQQRNNFLRSSTPQQDPSETTRTNATQNPRPRKQSQNCDGSGQVEKLNGTEATKKSPRPENTQANKTRRGSQNKMERSSRRSTSLEPVYPCGLCLSEVNDDQEAILCEASCQKWFHRVCTGMTQTAYNLLTAEASAVWGCDACMEDKGAQLLKTRDAPSMTSEGQS